MYNYLIYGLRVASELQIPEAFKVNTLDMADITIMSGCVPPAEENYETICLIAYSRTKTVIHINGTGSLLIQDGNKIIYTLFPNYSLKALREAILGDGFGQAMFQRGDFIIHGSALCYNGTAIIVSGRSGAGKSTLALELRRQGAEFMADDTVAVRCQESVVKAYPGYPQQKLCKDAALSFGYDINELIPISEERDKYAIRLLGEYHHRPEKVGMLAIIEPKEVDDVVIKEVMGSEKIQVLLKSSYVYRMYQSFSLPVEEMRKCIALANKIPMYRIIRPKVGITTRKQVECIEMHLNRKQEIINIH